MLGNFVTRCINGDALIFDIDNEIDAWHESSTSVSMHEYLGMSLVEYNAFVLDPDVLPFIISAHRENVPFEEMVVEAEGGLAARGASADQVLTLLKWLKENE